MIIITTLVIPPGGDAGPFDLYSDVDGYTVPFATNVSVLQLEAGYSSTVPDNATSIKVVSVGICTNFIILDIDLIPTTTTTSSSTSTSTSTSTTTSTSSSTTTTTTSNVCPCIQYVSIGMSAAGTFNYEDCFGTPKSVFLNEGAHLFIGLDQPECVNRNSLSSSVSFTIISYGPCCTPTSSTTTTTTTTGVPSVTICDQIWTLENLDVTTYRNGDPIPQVTDPNVWETLTTGAWCYYDNDPANGAVYGKLYNWHAVTDPRGLAPVGYHVPTEAEWQTLIETCLGGAIIAGGKMKETGLVHWDSPNTGATNSSGFTGLPGGYKDKNAASAFEYLRTVGFWWSSSLGTSSTYAWYARAYYNSDDALITQQTQEAGMSVRLIKD